MGQRMQYVVIEEDEICNSPNTLKRSQDDVFLQSGILSMKYTNHSPGDKLEILKVMTEVRLQCMEAILGDE